MSGLYLRLGVTGLLSLGASVGVFAAGPIGLLEAVRITLAQNPDIQIRSKQVTASEGMLQQASGQFDTALALSAERGADHAPLNPIASRNYAGASQVTTNTTTYKVALSSPLRNGIVLSPSISATSTFGTNSDLYNLPAQNQANVNFSILVPLLKGRGPAVAAGEEAANLQLQASVKDLRFGISQSVLNTVTAYWNLVAASKNLDVSRESESSVRQMVDDTQKLIKADELPAADINLIQPKFSISPNV